MVRDLVDLYIDGGGICVYTRKTKQQKTSCPNISERRLKHTV